VKIRALKRMAELVNDGQAQGDIATKDMGRPLSVPSRNTFPATLTDLGITRQRAWWPCRLSW